MKYELLCRLVNAIEPNIVPKINTKAFGFGYVDNIGNYLKACEKLGLHKSDLFDPPDLYEGKNINLVVNNIHVLGMFFIGIVKF